ncbi:MAG: T9SS type A sorting domain-containing protein [Bacteroidales bacterium]|jgi:aminopeptidase N|nr:T9SS type A sorting domain-containing protein [Bacteroidales bacterium]
MKNVLFLLIFTAINLLHGQTRIDSIHVANYDIHLSIVDFTNKSIDGYTRLNVVAKENISSFQLNFISSFEIDSILLNRQLHTNYSSENDLLTIRLNSVATVNDTLELLIYYRGVPFGNSWGGFAFSGEYAYNLGAAINDIPHSYGRVWFPCVDDFRDKSFFSFNIRTKSNKMAVCNGLLKDSTLLPDSTIVWKWKLQDPIPCYLASVAVGEYELYKDTFHSITSSVIPIEIYVPPAYIQNVAASFVHLKTVLRNFETRFAPYPRERIGYVGVNFYGGAMEHSTNIAYPYYAIDSTTEHQNLCFHELAHEWFGNLITCEKEEEMWINEGLATYCELITHEFLYPESSPNGYKNAVRDLHYKVLTTAHQTDGDYYALNNVPQTVTYGATSYEKGALIMHVLRNYLGDSLFFKGMQSILSHYAFKNIGSEDFFAHLSAVVHTDMSGFYEAYINQPGFLHFSIDSITEANVAHQYHIHIRQRLHHAHTFALNNRLDLSFFASNGDIYTEKNVVFSGETQTITLNIPFKPIFGVIDYNEKLADAVMEENRWLKKVGETTCPNAASIINVLSIQDSVFVRVEHNYIQPDGLKTPNSNIYRISDNHYWRVEYSNLSAIDAELRFQYVSRRINGIDYELLQGYSVDDLILLYRRYSGDDWVIVPTTRTGNSSIGYLKTTHKQAGEYALAIGDQTVSLTAHKHQNLTAYPNPTRDMVYLQINEEKYTHYSLNDLNGKRLFTNNINSSFVSINLADYPSGKYILQLYNKKKKADTVKLIKQ